MFFWDGGMDWGWDNLPGGYAEILGVVFRLLASFRPSQAVEVAG